MVEHAEATDEVLFLKYLPRNLSYAEEGYLDEYSVSAEFIRVPKAEKILWYRAKLRRTAETMETELHQENGIIDSVDPSKVRDSSADTEDHSKLEEKFYLGSDSGSEEGVFVNMMDDLDSIGSHDGGGSMESDAYFSADSINSPEENDCAGSAEKTLSEHVSNELRKVSSDGVIDQKPSVEKDLDKTLSTSDGNLSKERKFAKLKVELKSGTLTGEDAHQYLLEVPESPVFDEPEFNINKAELRKSSSLKSNKTPPGTPRRKKMVRFADVMGLDLESVRHVMNQEQPPRIPASAMADLRIGMEEERKDMGSRYLDICFPQPGALENFMQKVMANKLSLENCIITDLSITGIVRVANIGFHKCVRIRYTINSWVTFYDVMASYVQKSCDGPTDRFSFTIVAPATVGPGSRIEFCVSYTVNDTVYWDNNDGQNYVILCYAKTTPVETEEMSGMKKNRQAIPQFQPTPTNVTVHKGELAVLPCHINNLGPKMVVWRKASDEHPLTIGPTTFAPAGDISVDYNKLSDVTSQWNLMIKNVKPKHAGVYECQISSKGTYTHYVALNVLSEPLKRKPGLSITGTEYVNQYSDIHLKCNATGVDRAPEDIDWFFNGNKIHTSHPRWYGRIEILKQKPIPGRSYISELLIHLSTMADQGNYVCRSSDLSANNMKVHVLNADKNNPIVPRAPSKENQSLMSEKRNGSIGLAPSLYIYIMLWTLTILLDVR